jgi:hypothetical protein
MKNEPIWAPNLCILCILSICTDSFHLFFVYEADFHSARSQYKNRFIPRIQRMSTATFRLKIYLIPHTLRIRTDPLRVC